MQALCKGVEQGGALSLESVCLAAQPFLAALLAELFPERCVVVVTDNLKTQEVFQQDLQTWLAHRLAAGSPPLFYPAWEVLPQDARLPHADVISERLETLVALSNEGSKSNRIVVTSVAALLEKTLRSADLKHRTRRLTKGQRADPLDLIEWLESQGYEPEAQVAQKGDIALRGGIVDLWPLTSRFPVRLEFFGDELESLRHFDPLSQISSGEISEIIIPPGGELGLLKQALAQEEGEPVVAASLLDYLPAGTIFVLCEPELLNGHAERYESQSKGDNPLLIHWDDFQKDIPQRGMITVAVSQIEGDMVEDLTIADAAKSIDLRAAGQNIPPDPPALNFQGLEIFRPIGDRPPEAHIAEAQRKEFFGQLHRWNRQKYEVFVFCNNDGERQRFEEVWWESGLGNTNGLKIRTGSLARGFIFDQARLVVVTDAEIFGRYKVQRPRRLKSPHAQTGRSLLDINFSELEEGDYVVHLQHGIGRYLGLKVIPSRDLNPRSGEECLVIEYRPGDHDAVAPKLYVPVSEAHLVSKYVGAGKVRPPLNTLGGVRWAKTKAQAERAVRDLASDMLAVHAMRDSQPGHAFPTDSGWQLEFENSFIYEETPDQMRAIVATKRDMQASRPMDRLICGDVGYGKTEVALRAAFKAALAGKQVAVLTPTTILAQQHFNTFRERMADYPVRIELLSRFRTRTEIAAVTRQLTAGSVDIVIGTHRLLQGDIAFKDLGLVVIDEEQRFGVLHKERFKQLRATVDVLTLTATPIPRTLYLALAGARDMSTIETPPQDRLPVETIVAQYDERTVRDAIRREMNRGGQVFYLHNRVMDIEAVGARLRMLAPEARIAIGHGQMGSDELEEVMTAFVNGKTDVLLSTTIIESGLDIPNANTIIIDRADRFGLSDLYQLRGRVGRYKHQAYAYLLLPRHAGLLADARKRLTAIKQYSTLGSGFRIAMRDLEIRGAGNLLGPEQSGHLAAVGFELYCSLLQQSVRNLKGEKTKPTVEVQVRLDFLTQPHEKSAKPREETSSAANLNIQVPREVSTWVKATDAADGGEKAKLATFPTAVAALPVSYIAQAQHRIDIHRRLAQAVDAGGLNQLRDELRDRFGPLPPPAELLFKTLELKLLAGERNVSSIETKGDKLMLTRNHDLVMVDGKFPRLKRTTPAARLNEIRKFLLWL